MVLFLPFLFNITVIFLPESALKKVWLLVPPRSFSQLTEYF